MPINPIVLQRRHAELGRIRLGRKVETANGHTRPDKIDKFRFTSPNRRLIDDIAQLYGGDARAWDNSGKAEFEVFTTSDSVPVIVVRGGMSQWLEFWSAGGCIHRCDGETNVLTGEPCDLTEQVRVGQKTLNPHTEAKPTTRLSVMLTELGAIGVFRLETHGWNAAAELPALVDIAQHVGDLVPARLVLHERRSVIDGKTSRYVVPGLDLDVTPRQLVAITQAAQAGPQTPTAVGASTSPTAIGSSPTEPVQQPDWQALLENAASVEECQTVWRQAGEAGALTDELKETIKARARALTPTEPSQPEEPAQPADDGPDADALWSAVVAEAGRQNLTDGDVRGAFLRSYGHGVGEATTTELDGFLTELRTAGAA